MASDKVLLLNSLKDLRENELKEFQWHLKNDHESISESEMEKADRLKTVDKMVECFGPEEALRITVKILKKINQNNLAVELENKHKQGQAEERSEDPAPVIAESKPTEGKYSSQTLIPLYVKCGASQDHGATYLNILQK
ncbi:NACHT, LRR and PYD domains-containing protein 6-like [Sinocyclocheilus rhinocerous]|uniref:NACHT, LRR and PYD domains-containing protein 6-like n=1 Tax=Sinocyclocheilus rhinocerous TaxID=307959 RepID=UPI0007BAB165|nr:PREDICTED: NACHT, LRR and PYD domains-containing protein 6-like [Sinocyclocheilus rhinocerous]